MSVRKNYRFEPFVNSILEEVAEHLGKNQTEVLEQLIRDYVVYDMEAVEGQALMQRATERMNSQQTD